MKNFLFLYTKSQNKKENLQKNKIIRLLWFLWLCFDFIFIIYNTAKIPVEIAFKKKIIEFDQSFVLIIGMIEILVDLKMLFHFQINKRMLYREKIWKFISSNLFSDIFTFFFQIRHLESPENFHGFCYFIKIFALSGLFTYFLQENPHLKKAKKIYKSILIWMKYMILMHFFCCIYLYFNYETFFTRNSWEIYIKTLYFINSNMNIFHSNLQIADTKSVDLLYALGEIIMRKIYMKF